MPVGIFLTIGKYVFVALLYLFVVLVFRALVVRVTARRPAPTRVRRPVSAPITFQPVAHRQDAGATETAVPPAEQAQPAPANRVAADSGTIGEVREPRLREEGEYPPMLVVRASAEADLEPGHTFALAATVTIGRGPHNTIVLSGRYVSKEHAVIYLQEGQYLLADQNSTNGTYHNGTRITEPVPLADGDEITIGTTVFAYQST